MSLFRLVFILFVAVLLLPGDAKRQAELAAAARSGLERALTFCERNRGTCVAAHELWGNFVRKAEFGVELASRLARSTAGDGQELDAEPVRRSQRGNANARGTLTPSDLGPEWRGRSARNGS